MADPSALTFFQSFRKFLGDGTFDLNPNTVKASVHTPTFVPNVATMIDYADLTSEVTSGNGHKSGNHTLASVAWTLSGSYS